MPTLRTTPDLRKYDARRLMARGYEILHIETRHGDDGDATDIVWTIERLDQPPWCFHTGYNLRRIGGIWRIVFCVAYQEPAVRQPG